MSGQDGFTDSTDWLTTPLLALAPLDAALRCQVCKDFFTTPMITSCSHTFCSLCIRRYLSQEGRCPACREADQEIKLRRNWSIEEAVTQFRTGREGLLRVARSEMQAVENNGARPKKRRKVEDGNGVGRALPERRSTRSQSRRLASQDTHMELSMPLSQEEGEEPEEIQDSDGGSVYEDEARIPQRRQQASEPNDGLVACPICQRRMKEAVVNSHLDKCMAGNATPSPRRSNTPQIPASATSLASGQSKSTQQPLSGTAMAGTALERLPTVNYSLFNDNSLRKKLKDLGIPAHGSKDLMRKRHTEWINLWNANCDSLHPVSKSQLLRDLDRWERTLGRQIDSHKGPTGVMVKDFDRDGWQKTNKSDFDDLIRRAREKRASANATDNHNDGDNNAATDPVSTISSGPDSISGDDNNNKHDAPRRGQQDILQTDEESRPRRSLETIFEQAGNGNKSDGGGGGMKNSDGVVVDTPDLAEHNNLVMMNGDHHHHQQSTTSVSTWPVDTPMK